MCRSNGRWSHLYAQQNLDGSTVSIANDVKDQLRQIQLSAYMRYSKRLAHMQIWLDEVHGEVFTTSVTCKKLPESLA